jgi:hypothetical protein
MNPDHQVAAELLRELAELEPDLDVDPERWRAGVEALQSQLDES